MKLGFQTNLQTIHAALGGVLHGNGSLTIERLAPLGSATKRDLAFVAHIRYVAQLQTTQAGALIVPPAMADAADAHPEHIGEAVA